MKPLCTIISYLALLGIIVPPCLFLSGGMELSQVKTWMLVSSVIWFVSVPFWMGREKA